MSLIIHGKKVVESVSKNSGKEVSMERYESLMWNYFFQKSQFNGAASTSKLKRW